jgi:5,10-methylenetetrahydromethanopterin reductase
MRRSIGIAFQTDKPLSEYGPLARVVESYGFSSVAVYNDLYYQPSWLPLLEIARSTHRVQLGPAAVNPYTNHPINIAGNIALIDEVSDGRAYLGLARGGWLEHLGMRPLHPVSGLREAMECIQQLLRKSTSPYQGKSFVLRGGETLRWEINRSEIPFMLGSWGRKTIETCFDLISEIKIGGSASTQIAGEYREFIDRLSDRLEDSQEKPRLVMGAVSVVDEDGKVAREHARREAAFYIPVIADLDPGLNLDPDLLRRIVSAHASQDQQQLRTLISEELLKQVAFVGTAEQVIQQAEALFETGVDRIEFGTPHGIPGDTGLKILGEQVYPALKGFLS